MEEKVYCFAADEILQPREVIMEVMEYTARMGLTDFTGGNMALRVGNKVYSTQTHSADLYRWKLRPDNIMVTDAEGNVLEGRKENLSREIDLHLRILRKFPSINCTLHGNTFYSPLIVEGGIKNPKGITQTAVHHSMYDISVVPQELGVMTEGEYSYVLEIFEKKLNQKEALVAIMPLHGVMVAAESHNDAFALLDALEANSKFIYKNEVIKASIKINASGIQKDDQSIKLKAEPATNNSRFITAEDIDFLKGKTSQIVLESGCSITALAESRAQELGINIKRN